VAQPAEGTPDVAFGAPLRAEEALAPVVVENEEQLMPLAA
jgi:hypothetical protein